MEELDFGKKIKSIRIESGLSIRKASEMAGITPSMLSQIENGQVNPSINTLRAIALVLDTPLYKFFTVEEHTDPVVRSDKRKTIGSKSEPDTRYELLTSDTSGDIEFCIMKIPAGHRSYRDAKSHIGEEVAYMLSGKQVELNLDGKQYILKKGDSVRILANTPHVWINHMDIEAQIIFAVTPPTF